MHDHAGIIRGDWKGGLGPGEKTLIEGFKGLSVFSGGRRQTESRLNLRTQDARGRLTPPARAVFLPFLPGLFQSCGEQTLNNNKEVQENGNWDSREA